MVWPGDSSGSIPVGAVESHDAAVTARRPAVLAKARMSNLHGRIIGLLGILVMGLSCTGCAQQLDALTSERLRNDPLHLMFGSDDPIFILRNVEDSDARLRAMQDLKEPKLDPKTAPVQDEIVQILAVTANSDNHAVCRLAAVEALARFDDPRAGQILVDAYHNASDDAPRWSKLIRKAEWSRSNTRRIGADFNPDFELHARSRRPDSFARIGVFGSHAHSHRVGAAM